MPELHITVANKVANYTLRDGSIVSDNTDYTAVFTFDEEWAQESKKVARFVWNGRHYDVDIDANGTCPVPRITGRTPLVHVGVYAGELKTSTDAAIPCTPSILSKGTNPHEEYAEGYVEEIRAAEASAKTSAAEAKKAAEEAKEAAASGGGGGGIKLKTVTIESSLGGACALDYTDLPGIIDGTPVFINYTPGNVYSGPPGREMSLGGVDLTRTPNDAIYIGDYDYCDQAVSFSLMYCDKQFRINLLYNPNKYDGYYPVFGRTFHYGVTGPVDTPNTMVVKYFAAA